MATIEINRDSLWTIIIGPTVWAAHFLLCYGVAAVYCAKAGDAAANLAGVRIAIAVLTVIALILIARTGRSAYRQWGFGAADPPHDDDTRVDRRRFLGYATLLLCGLSFVATVYVALPALIVSTCR